MMKKIVGTTLVTLALLAGAGIASAQTTDTTGTTPTTPNTGAGGNAMENVIVLASSAAFALGGIAYLARRSRAVL